MKLLTVIGARPQFIKAAMLSRAIRLHNEGGGAPKIQEELIHTGQHYDYKMSQVFFDELGIAPPAVNLNIGSGTHAQATAQMLTGIEAEIVVRKPDRILVYGDTNSTLAGALAASKLNVPVSHVEAGERSYNREMPEEVNRVLVDHIADQLFCCSEKAKRLLQAEGIARGVSVSGDLMLDAFQVFLPKAQWPASCAKPTGPFAVATIHRAQNTDHPENLRALFAALSALPMPVLLPLHPRTAKAAQTHGAKAGPNVHVLEPVSYFEMLALLRDCSYVLTDSGGVQKEAYYAGKKCIVLREETEWSELVDAGATRLAGTSSPQILSAAQWASGSSALPAGILGDGGAGARIVKSLLS